ncbi:MAG: hypothetical protein ACRC7O_00080, partial [Fimbriiglobus sp.]
LWSASKAEKDAAVAADIRHKKATDTTRALNDGMNPRIGDNDLMKERKPGIRSKLAVVMAALTVAQPATAALTLDAAKLEEDLAAAQHHLQVAQTKGGNPADALQDQLAFVTAICGILKTHFGMDEQSVDYMRYVIYNAVIAGHVVLPGPK